MNSAQTAFATLIGLFAVLGMMLILGQEYLAGWMLLGLAIAAFLLFTWMVVVSALTRRRVVTIEADA